MWAVTQQQQEFDLADLVRDHQVGVWRYLRFIGADATETEDLVQETFLAFMRAKFTYHGPAATSAFLRQVARNQLLKRRRQQGREVNTVKLESAESVWCEVSQEDGLNDYVSAMQDCVDNLRERSQQVIHLHYAEGLSRTAIARRMEMKPDGIKTLLRRTRQLLRECVERKVKT
jgi:RNA polymerase sigma-70 factor (ECF subfamily)